MKQCHTIFLFLATLRGFDYVSASGFSAILASELMRNIFNEKLINNVDGKNPTCSTNPEEDMTVIELIRNSGYPAEKHFVTTEDGYILGLHRIPGKSGSPAVLLHHGLFDSSFGWIAIGKGRALAYTLADKGYDVWLANARGNTYSKKHTTLIPSDTEFWNFSFHEIGVYDLPAEINYILSLKNESEKIFYVGHSMGTTTFFVMASERPDVASKVEAMFGLAPAAFVGNVKGLSRFIEPPIRNIQEELKLDGKDEFLSHSVTLKVFAKCVCNRPLLRELCLDFIFSSVGYHPNGINVSQLPLLLSHTPAGSSLKNLFHYGLEIRSKKFQQYDYGSIEANLKIYGKKEPPEYDLGKIEVPVAVFWSENDLLTPPKDVRRLYKMLPNKIEMYRVNDPDWNHLDFIWSYDAPKLVYQRLFYLMDKYRRTNETSRQ